LDEVDLKFLEEFQWDIARDLEEIQPLMDRCSKNLSALRVLEKVENYLEKVLQELQRIVGENNGTS
jgi:hypothetical protein